jgi:hypothetical protein
MKLSIFILFFFNHFFFISFGQVDHSKALQTVLNQDQIGKEYSFSKSIPNNYDSLVLIYLGEIKSKGGQIYKIITSRWYWGMSPRATSRIVIFNGNKEYLGDYYLTMTYDVPDKIEGSSLVFTNNKNSDCDSNLVTKISFKNGIPRKFFLKCKGKFGDIYTFESR